VERLSLDILTVMGMDPLAYIRLAADLGCDYVGMQVSPVTTLSELYPHWSLRDNPRLVRDVKSALAHHGLSLHLGEGFLLRIDTDMRNFAADLDVLSQVGARCANICSFDGDRNRAFDALAVFAEMAARADMSAILEFAPGLGIADLPTAIEAVRHVGMPNFGLVIDAMHFFRSGSTVKDLARLDPAMIGYVQICDVPWESSIDYVTEACFQRACPGQGDLPLEELIAALPREVIIGLETPMRARFLGGEDPVEVLKPCVAAARRLMGEAKPRKRP
jgi:sugar phosphate isomerase/epimerase